MSQNQKFSKLKDKKISKFKSKYILKFVSRKSGFRNINVKIYNFYSNTIKDSAD